MQLPVVQERLAKVGTEPMPMSVDQFGKYFREDVLATAKLMQRVGDQARRVTAAVRRMPRKAADFSGGNMRPNKYLERNLDPV